MASALWILKCRVLSSWLEEGPPFMDQEFDAESFTARLRLGEFDTNLFEEVGKLSVLQLEKVADLLKTTQTNRRDRPYQSL